MVKLAWKMSWRDWRAGELRFLLIALVLAVSTLAAVGFFVDRMRQGLQRDAAQLLGADLLIAADQPMPERWLQQAQQQGLSTAQTVVFPSMAMAATPNADAAPRSRLISLKAVSSAYPLRGQLKWQHGQQEVAAVGIPAAGEVWLDSAVAQALQIQVGQSLRLGDKEFRYTQIIAQEPDRGAGFVNFAPRAMIALSDLPATRLIQNGSRVTYRLLLAGPTLKLQAYEQAINAEIKRDNLKGIRVESLENGRPDIRTTIDRASQFLSLVSLLSAMLAALAIAMAARRFMVRHLDACAMLRCLGLTQNQVLAVYLLEFLGIGLVASGLGIVLGFAGHYVLLDLLGSLIAKDIPAASLLPVWQSLGLGMVLLLGFALPPVLQLRNVPHNRVIRRETEAPNVAAGSTYGGGLVLFFGLLLWQSSDLKLGLMTGAGFIAGFALFAALSWLALRCLKLARTWLASQAWRFAITALLRRPAATILQTVALALGLMALLLVTVVRTDLIQAWRQATPADAPNQFIINIQPDQQAELSQRLHEFKQPAMYPMIRGRLVQINQRQITAETYQEERARNLAEREFNLSSMTALPKGNKITAGNWFDLAAPKQVAVDVAAAEAGAEAIGQASVEEGIAKTLNLQLGDILYFDVAGQKVAARISSLRKLDWGSMQVNFFVILDPTTAQDLPQTWITAFHLPAQQADVVNQLMRDFPNLTIVDVGATLKQVQGVLAQVSYAIEFLFVFTLLAGVMVLYAALLASQDLRIREAALLRALGATRQQLARAQWVEFALLGGLAGFMAAAGASAIAYLLARFSFNFAWEFSPVLWLAGLAVGTLCASLGGWLGLRKVLQQAPLISLREN